MIVALGALWAPPAQAGTPGPTESLGKAQGIEYLRAKFGSVVSQATQPANCDGDSSVTGGGGSIDGDPATATLNESYPDPPFSWDAEGSSTGGPSTLTAYAVCAGTVPDYYTSQSSLGTNTVLHSIAACGAGDPIGGGGGATGPGIVLIGSEPRVPPSAPVGWAPSAYNNTTNDTLFDSSVVCSDDLTVRYRRSDPIRLRPGETVKAIAHCRPNEAVLGGGFAGVKGEVIGYRIGALASKPWDSKQDAKGVPEDGWLAKARSLESLRVSLVANAVCKRPG